MDTCGASERIIHPIRAPILDKGDERPEAFAGRDYRLLRQHRLLHRSTFTLYCLCHARRKSFREEERCLRRNLYNANCRLEGIFKSDVISIKLCIHKVKIKFPRGKLRGIIGTHPPRTRTVSRPSREGLKLFFVFPRTLWMIKNIHTSSLAEIKMIAEGDWLKQQWWLSLQSLYSCISAVT